MTGRNTIVQKARIYLPCVFLITCLLFIFCFAFASPSQAADLNTNLLQDGGGEDGGDGTNTVLLSNHGWTGGDTIHWYAYTASDGLSPVAGNYFLGYYSHPVLNTPYSYSTYQDVDVSSQAASINAGQIVAQLTGSVQKTGAAASTAKIGLEALDSSGSTTYLGEYAATALGEWQAINIRGAVPSGTVTLRVRLTGINIQGGYCAFDVLSLQLQQDTTQPPAISAIADQNNNSGQTLGPLPFTISDGDTALTSLTVNITSDNATLIPDTNIAKTVDTANGNCTVSLTSAAGNTGSAVITVAVSDGNKTTYEAFTVTVYPDVLVAGELVFNGDCSSLDGWQGSDIGRFTCGSKFYVSTLPAGSSTIYLYQDINIGKFAVPIDEGLLEYNTSINAGSTGDLIIQGLNAFGSVIWTNSSGKTMTRTIQPQTRTLRVQVGGGLVSWVDDISCKISGLGLPKMTTLADQTLDNGAGASLPFVIAYAGDTCNVSASSSNTDLLPDANLVISGSGYSRSIAVTPASGKHGSSVVTVSSGGVTLDTFNVTVSLAPGQPTNVTAVAGDCEATISFQTPADDGGSAITGYTVTASPGGQTVYGAGSPLTMTGLTNGQAYTFTVVAANAIGNSLPSSPSTAVTPEFPYAAAPSSVTLEAGSVNPVGGVTNVAIPAVGSTDITGTVTGWVAGAHDKIKFTVADTGGTSAIKINDVAYTSGTDYAIGAASSLTIVVTTSQPTKIDAVRTFTVPVTAAPAQTTPTFDPPAGDIAFPTTVNIISAGADAIYYTTDSSDPSTASTNQAITPLVINAAMTVKALAVKDGLTNSAIGSAAYTQAIATAPGAITLAAGGANPVGSVTNVAIPAAGATDTTGAVTGWVTSAHDKIKFTVTYAGSAASTITINGGAYTSGADYTIAAASDLTIVVTTTEAGKVNAVRTFTVSVTPAAAQATPTFSPAAGKIAFGATITIISAGAEAIYYTTDGSEPTTASTNQAATPLVINTAMTVKALAVKDGLTNSAIGSAAYTQAIATAPSAITLAAGGTNPVGGVTDVAIPAPGATDTTGTVTNWVTGTHDKIKFTVTDAGGTSVITINDVPYTGGSDYSIAAAGNLTIVVTTTEAGKQSTVRTFTVSVTPAAAQATPTFSPAAGEIVFSTAVTISSAGADAIYYTTDGSEPTTASTNQAITPVVINAAVTLKAIAVKDGLTNSDVSSAAYTQEATADLTDIALSGTPANYTFTAGTYTYNGVAVATGTASIAVTPSGTGTITVDGTAVPSGSASGPIALTEGTEKTITVMAMETGKAAKTYVIKVTRAAGASSGGGLPPAATSTTVTGEVINSKTGEKVKGLEAQVSIQSNGTTTVEVKSQEAILFHQPDGTQAPVSDASKLGFSAVSNPDAGISMKADGTIQITNLVEATDSTFEVTFDLGNGQIITIGAIEVQVGENGEVSITSTLIDPYGIILDSATGQPIAGVKVTLYYADTARNKRTGKTPDTPVDLPILNGFKPNDNKNPQVSEAEGAYAFMVFPTSDYYLVATKEDYETYKSLIISVEQEIVKWDFKMNKPLTGIQRLSGESRVDTALAIAQANYTAKLKNVVLATAANYPDALAGSVLAYKLNAPILLIGGTAAEQEKIIQYIKTDLEDSGTVYILGGTGAVSKDMEDKVSAAGFTKITRISGGNRSATALKIADQLEVETGRPLILVNEDNYADALAVSTSAAAAQRPILLVEKDRLSAEVKARIAAIKPIKVYLIGGEGVISQTIAGQVAELTGLDPENIVRIGGEDRYDTALAVAKYFNFSGQNACVATGKNFPDALAGSVYAANHNSPIILVDEAISEETKEYLQSRKMTGGAIFGGEKSIEERIEQELLKLLVN